MTSKSGTHEENNGEILVVWQKYKARGPDELTLHEGDIVELLDTDDPSRSPSKKIKLDPEFDSLATNNGGLLDSAAARHKLSVKPQRRHASSRYSPSRSQLSTRWLVRQTKGEKRQGWVPCNILQSVDEPVPGTGLPGDAAFRRQAVVKELVETEQEFVKDLDFVVQEYLIRTENTKVPKIIKDNLELVFGGLVEIADFHRSVLMEGVKYYANEPNLLGKAFLRLERDFDKHVNYCTDEPLAQTFLESCAVAKEYYDELSQRLGDDKTLSEHLKLPIQRINDYQLLLKELVRYSECLGEDNTNLQKALELMLSVPHRAQDDKFTNSIEGYRGNIHKLGRLLSHDWFSVSFGNTTKERYLFLFKGRILISKVRRISEDRSVFQLKDIIRLPQVELKDHPTENHTFELVDKVGGHSLTLTARRDNVKELWLKEIREFATDFVEESTEDIQIISEATSDLTSVEEKKTYELPVQTISEAQKLLANVLKEGLKQELRSKTSKGSEKTATTEDSQEFKTPPESPEVSFGTPKPQEVDGGRIAAVSTTGVTVEQKKVEVAVAGDSKVEEKSVETCQEEKDMSRRYTGLGSSGKGGG